MLFPGCAHATPLELPDDRPSAHRHLHEVLPLPREALRRCWSMGPHEPGNPPVAPSNLYLGVDGERVASDRWMCTHDGCCPYDPDRRCGPVPLPSSKLVPPCAIRSLTPSDDLDVKAPAFDGASIQVNARAEGEGQELRQSTNL